MATRAVYRLLECGAAGRFAEVAGRPGFPHALVATLEELRASRVGAAALRAIPSPGPDLAAFLERVENELAALGLADRATVYAVAREVVERDGVPPAGLPVLLLDLAPQRAVEEELLAALVARAPDVFATALAGDGAVARLERILGVDASTGDPAFASDTEAARASSLARLQAHLFEDSAPEPRELDGSVSLASWPGEARECVEIARRLRVEAAAGTPFDRMAVFLRAPHAYRAHLEEAFRRAEVPAFFARGATRPEPAGRAMLALLACAAEGLSARRFAEYLSLAQVPAPGHSPDDSWAPPAHDLMPAAPLGGASAEAAASDDDRDEPTPDPDAAVVEGTLRAPWRWERLLVDAAVIGGLDRWRRRLDGLAQEVEARRAEVADDDARAASWARTAADLGHLREFALPLIERLAAFPAEATWETWLAHLRELAAVALRDPSSVLTVLAELDPLGPVGPVDLVIVQHVLSPRLHDLTVAADRRPGGAVFVAPADMARGLAFDVVFVPGLAEKLFPPRILEDPLLLDEARKTLGGALSTMDTRVANERLALRVAVGAARKHVALSWPRVDLENARPRVPSFYALEAMRAAEGRLPGFDELRARAESSRGARRGWPAPERPEEAIDDTEYDLALLARLKDADPASSTGAASYLLQANAHLARALRARGRRWLRRWTPADGLVDPPEASTSEVAAFGEALAALERHRMGARAFSPTALENFASCPYRFLLQAIHRLEPREEAEPLEVIDPLTKGSLFHEVQFEVLTALRDRGHLPLDPEHLEAAIEVLDEAIERVASDYAERLAPAIPRVWADGVIAIRGDLREWLRRSTEGAAGWVPHRFELSFGLPDRARATADAKSVAAPVRILDGAALLRGSIDLVERRDDGTIRVTDHKTGKARVPAGAVVKGGQALQPVLYALVAEQILEGPVESGRLYYCTADGDFTERTIPLDPESRVAGGVAIEVIGRALETGFFPAAPSKGACTWCDYRTVCGPGEEFRTSRKPADRLADLTRLRDLE